MRDTVSSILGINKEDITASKILIVEDDVNLLRTLEYNLRREGYEVLTATDGTKALDTASSEKPGLVVLDIMLPGLNGFEVCRILRKQTTVPILMLTARDEEVDKIVGLEIGADDYMTKPFSMRELLARIKAMLRRTEMEALTSDDENLLKIANIKIDVARRKVSLGQSQLQLTPKEFDLLVFLAKNRGIVFSREQLLEKVWGYDYAGDTRTIDVHIRWLREKIEKNPARPQWLITVRGVGYKLEG
jgi:two-component system OmpR family response regulator